MSHVHFVMYIDTSLHTYIHPVYPYKRRRDTSLVNQKWSYYTNMSYNTTNSSCEWSEIRIGLTDKRVTQHERPPSSSELMYNFQVLFLLVVLKLNKLQSHKEYITYCWTSNTVRYINPYYVHDILKKKNTRTRMQLLANIFNWMERIVMFA